MNRLFTIILFALISVPLFLHSQTLDWAIQFTSDKGVQVIDLAIDDQGDIYICGEFTDTVDVDPGPGVIEFVSEGGLGSFIVKLDSTGSLIWGKQINAVSPSAIDVDGSGNVFVGFTAYDSVDFDPGQGVAWVVPLGNFTQDIALLKLTANGDFDWVQQYGDVDSEFFTTVIVDPQNDVYVIGSFGGTVDFDPGAGTSNMTSAGSADAFILKLSNNGQYVWSRQFGDAGFDFTSDACLDQNGNLYVYGEFSGTVDFDFGAGSSSYTAQGSRDVFLCQVDINGGFGWAIAWGGSTSEIAQAVHIDPGGGVYAVGEFEGTVDFDPGTGTLNETAQGIRDVYISKIDETDGSLSWNAILTGDSQGTAFDVEVDNLGTVYVVGVFGGTIDFDPSSGVVELTGENALDSDIFVVRFSSNGDYECVTAIVTASTQIAYEAEITAAGKLVIGGLFESTVDFDPGPGVTELTAAGDALQLSNIDSDGFLFKVGLEPCPSVGIEEVSIPDFTIFPNPTSDQITIEFESVHTEVKLNVLDAMGAIILEGAFQNTNRILIDHDLMPGAYLLHMETDEGTSTTKLIVH